MNKKKQFRLYTLGDNKEQDFTKLQKENIK